MDIHSSRGPVTGIVPNYERVAREHFLTSGVCRLEQVAGCNGKFGNIGHH